ncbi:hypothetical protein HRbin34_00620 [bacterium HR34]|nr:hypothetical protein HRbin34_00620 [bacterium HR34]
MKTCPICKINLDKTIMYNVEVDYCPQCLGIWFDKDELRLAKDFKDENLKWVDIDLWSNKENFKILKIPKLCPVNRLPLYEVMYGDSDIKVDVCNVCDGVWLDRGEFAKIIKYLKTKGDYELIKHPYKVLKDELWEVFVGPETFKEELEDLGIVLDLLSKKLFSENKILQTIIASLPK